jgi:hypothetical protein
MASLVGVMANFGAAYEVAPKISLRGDVGLGLTMLGGIQEMGSPFTEGGAGTTGTLTMFGFRVAASGEYGVSPNLSVVATPLAFSLSPAKSGLRSDISSITRIDFMVGLGYKM